MINKQTVEATQLTHELSHTFKVLAITLQRCTKRSFLLLHVRKFFYDNKVLRQAKGQQKRQ